MNGTFVGTWSVSHNGRDQLQYADSWGESDEGRPISQSAWNPSAADDARCTAGRSA
ncbi:hypothetical protein [Pandoraea capi]|uniref:hypothetical protein n=1 Tax=Pandoraea capi TaxID=2508286 RepID=UPI001582B9D1|nr:hypothetical protein [Pandoraea capi]